MAVGGPIGNTKGLALKDPEMRQRAYKSFCEHRAKGKAIKSWYFIEGDSACTWQTMQEYMKDTVEFNPIQKDIAESEGYQLWETITEQSANGKNKNANTASLQMVMRNKFGWDKDKEKDRIIETLSSLLKSKDVIQDSE
jgi:hypothetical protein